MPSEAQMHQAVHTYLQALEAADVDTIVGLYAPDAVVEDPVGSAPRRGHAAIREFYAGSVALGLRVSLDGPVRAVANEAVFAFSVSLVYQGQAVTIQPIDHFRFDESGKVVSMRAFFGPANQRASAG